MDEKREEPREMLSAKRRAFVLELRDLTMRHGVAVGGCGCCESPFLLDVDTSDERAGYGIASRTGGQLTWLEAGESFDGLGGQTIERVD